MGQNLILIAGYPKSGSTWVRYVFEVLRRGRPVSINDMEGGRYGARRRMLFDELAPVNASDLLPPEIDDCLPNIFRTLAAGADGPHIIKVHDAAIRTRSGEWLYPPETVRTVIYLMRHPFDVAVSYAHHLGLSVQDAVVHMGQDDQVAVSRRRLRLPLHERLGSWSGNVISWLDARVYNVLPVRYEDVFADPPTVFGVLAKAAGFPSTPAAVVGACEAARFERLKEQERTSGFSERPRTSSAFFRAGRPRSWEGVLDDALRTQLLAEHGAVMTRLGYDSDGSAINMPQILQPPAGNC